MSFDLVGIFEKMSAFAFVIVGILLVMALSSAAVGIERWWVLRTGRSRARRLAARVAPAVSAGRWEEVVAEARRDGKNPFALLLEGVAGAWMSSEGDGTSIPERVKNEASRCLENAEADLRRGMGVLASVGSVAPFVGLLGTVIGIINAFEGIAADNSSGIGAVAAGIAEALIVTAIGLAVAIPAVLTFNVLNGRVESEMLALKTAAGEMMDDMVHRPVRLPFEVEEAARANDRTAPRQTADSVC